MQLGHHGLTEAVLRQIDLALEQHELIKVKASKECPTDPDALAPEIERETHSTVAQIIGRVLVVYRRRKQKPKIVLPAPRKKGA